MRGWWTLTISQQHTLLYMWISIRGMWNNKMWPANLAVNVLVRCYVVVSCDKSRVWHSLKWTIFQIQDSEQNTDERATDFGLSYYLFYIPGLSHPSNRHHYWDNSQSFDHTVRSDHNRGIPSHSFCHRDIWDKLQNVYIMEEMKKKIINGMDMLISNQPQS
jgi:hypothetical protein